MVPNDSMLPFDFPVFAHGALHPAGSLLLPVEDQGFQLGLALFETLLVEAQHAYFVDAHLERLEQGARGMQIPWNGAPEVKQALQMLMQGIAQRAGAPERYALRVTLSAGVPGAGPTLVLSARSIPALPRDGVKVWLSDLRVIGDGLAELKASSRLRYVLARREAQAQGCYEALLLNTSGALAEGTISNLFAYGDGVLRTPALGSGCLGGIMRQLVLKELERDPLVLGDGTRVRVECGELFTQQLGQADELFLSNSTGRLIPIAGLLGAETEPQSWPAAGGAVILALGQRIQALEEGDRLP